MLDEGATGLVPALPAAGPVGLPHGRGPRRRAVAEVPAAGVRLTGLRVVLSFFELLGAAPVDTLPFSSVILFLLVLHVPPLIRGHTRDLLLLLDLP